jgi:ribose transport system ATP-binding protein
MSDIPLALELRSVSKSFPGVRALSEVSLRVVPGEVHALLGENGAGKSTLLKILNGLIRPDGGEILIEGKPVHIDSPKAARAAGLAMIHQELQLVPEMDVAQNMYLGVPPTRLGVFADRVHMRREAERVLGQLGATFDVRRRLGDLSVAQRQMVEIARALLWDARIIAMDEPTSALSPQEFEALVSVIEGITRRGVAVIYVSHKLGEVFRLCKRATILRDGSLIGEFQLTGMREHDLVSLMVGRTLDLPPRTARAGGTPVLEAANLVWRDRVRDVSLSVRRSEILGIAGLVGAGRTELVRLLSGMERPDSGEIRLRQKVIRFRSAAAAVRAGIGLAPEDRKREGIIPLRPIHANVALPVLRREQRGGIVLRKRLRQRIRKLTRDVQLRPPDIDRPIALFSGGNQQKAIICRWLLANSDVLIFDEPTRGIDIGAKHEIYLLIERLADSGKAIIVVSSELPEIIRISDRVLVMREGRITAELPHAELSEQAILRHAVPGVAQQAP